MALLSEVARTGRKFRRRSVPDYWWLLRGKEIIQFNPHGAGIAMSINAEQLVATDWEAEPLRLELTAEDIIRAARTLDDLTSKRRLSAAEFGKEICKALGLLEDE